VPDDTARWVDPRDNGVAPLGRPTMETQSAFRNLTSPVRASLEGIASLPVAWARRSPLLYALASGRRRTP
jgi:hypothetical protein